MSARPGSLRKGDNVLSIHNNFNLANLSRNMRSTGREQSSVMEKLSSGYRINKASDDPSGLIQSERLRSQIAGIERAIQNSVETDNLLGVVEGAFSEVNSVLKDLKNLAIESANTGVISKEMIAANQAEMDAGIQAIDRIFNSTSYAGDKILENLDIKDLLPGKALSADQLRDFGVVAGTLPYFIDEKRIASGESFIGAADGALINGDKTFIIPGLGENGDETLEIEFKEGTSLDDVLAEIRRAVNGDADSGASKPAGDSKAGADGTGAASGTDGKTAADDAAGTATDTDTEDESEAGSAVSGDPVLKANPDGLLSIRDGQKTNSIGRSRYGEDANEVTLTSNFLDSLKNLSDDDAKEALTEHINGFVPIISLDDAAMSDDDKALYQAALDLKNLNIGSLGSVQGKPYTNANGEVIVDTYTLKDVFSGGKASLYEDPVLAMKIVEKSSKEILATRATIGAIRTAFSHERGALSAAHENLTRSESMIRDTDMASSMTDFTRTKIMAQASTRMFAAVQEQYQNTIDLLM